MARVQRRKVDETQVHALAQLKGLIANEEHARDMRLDDVHRLIAVAVARRVAQEGADLALLVVGERKDGIGHWLTLRLGCSRRWEQSTDRCPRL